MGKEKEEMDKVFSIVFAALLYRRLKRRKRRKKEGKERPAGEGGSGRKAITRTRRLKTKVKRWEKKLPKK